MKKVLIVHATAGIGHVKAALAVGDALKKYRSETTSCEIVDILDFTNCFLQWLYRRFYIILVQHFSALWAIIYYILDIPPVFACIKGLRSSFNTISARRFAVYLSQTKPDVIVSTHFFSTEVISTLKKKGRVHARLVTVITDFKLHTYWRSPETDCFIVAAEPLKQELMDAGIEESRIAVLGIPIQPRFHEPLDKVALCQKLGIRNDTFTVLITSGGFGVGPVEALVRQLAAVEVPVQLLVVCGKNPALRNEISQLKRRIKNPLHVYGFIDNMHELMHVSDLVISKSGGMTVSEALAKELPLIVVAPVPGQEMKNCSFLVEHDVALREDRPVAVKAKVLELCSNPSRLENMKDAIRRIKKPNPSHALTEVIAKL
jgi:processive 1,2-diacylglycerol beta-glucosyltransferase